jgi:hypothetical protein
MAFTGTDWNCGFESMLLIGALGEQGLKKKKVAK